MSIKPKRTYQIIIVRIKDGKYSKGSKSISLYDVYSPMNVVYNKIIEAVKGLK